MNDEPGGGASLTTDPAAGTSAATDISLREYFEALRHSDDKVDLWIYRFYEERDRRFSEVALEREKALKIKETADETARILVAENQAYRDEKANELRAQIEGERGNYLSRSEYLTAHQSLTEKLDAGQKETAERFGRVEAFQSKLLGALALASVFVPVVTGVIVYVLTH
jgi:hypothetical protein